MSTNEPEETPEDDEIIYHGDEVVELLTIDEPADKDEED